MHVGIDFGLSVTDALLVEGTEIAARASRLRPGPASEELVGSLLGELLVNLGEVESRQRPTSIGVTGGRARELPVDHAGMRIVQVDEPSAIGRGGLALAGLERALVVSCGTGTAMIASDGVAGEYRHVSGTPVGGGTLEGLGSRLLGTADAFEITEMALSGDASAVDTTLGEVLGGSLGSLPPTATAVSLGRLARLTEEPAREDLAAGLTTMVAQTIAFIALGAARSNGMEDVVLVGRLSERTAVSRMIAAVFAVFGFPRAPVVAPEPGFATVYGAALLAHER